MKELWEKIVAAAGSNFGLKALALIIAVGLWFAGHRDIERALEVPVEFRNIPPDLMVVDNRVDFVVLRLIGPRTLVSTIDSDELKLTIDLNGAKSGAASYPLSSTSFAIPRGVTVARITPPVVHLRLEPLLKRSLPVNVRLSGKPAPGFRVSQTSVEPEMVSVEGPAEDLRRLAAVETVPVDIEGAKAPFKRKLRLAADGKQFSFSPDQVTISVVIEPEEITREFPRIEVQARTFGGVYEANPKTVSLTLAGPKNSLDALELGTSQVYLDLRGLPAGEHNLTLSIQLPPGIKIVEQKPQRIRVRIVKPEAR
jgi:YbbR domain-containing protein